MTMEKLKKCRICLVDNVRMFKVTNKTLQEVYEKLTDVPFVTEDSRPMLTCLFCSSKLKQCYQLQRKCLEAEVLFAQMLNGDYETKPLVNQGLLEFCSGFTITPTVHISTFYECQTDSIVIKEELPEVCEAAGDIIEPKEEHQCYEVELENFDNSCLDPLHRSQSDLEDDVLLMEFKIEVEEEEEVSKKKQRVTTTKKSIAVKEESPADCVGLDNIIQPKEEHQSDELETANFNISCLDLPPYQSKSELKDDVPLVEFKTELEEKQEVSKKTRSARETKRATVAKKVKLDTRRTKLEYAITAEQTKKNNSDSNVIWITQKRTSKPETYFKEPYKCDQRSVNSVKKNIQHTRTQLDKTPYKCDVCQHSFSKKYVLTKHTRIHTGERPYKCDFCERSFIEKSALRNHIRVHTGEKPFKCDICQCSFRQSGNLKTHVRLHTGEKAYKCDLCQRSFSEKSTLANHIRIHTGEKPFKCDICQRSFRQNSHLTTHIRQHTGEKPYKCDVCQRSFTQKWDLTKHNRLHTGEKPYKCDECERTFTQKGALTKHIRLHTGEKPYKCDVCKRSFREKRALTKHICTQAPLYQLALWASAQGGPAIKGDPLLPAKSSTFNS